MDASTLTQNAKIVLGMLQKMTAQKETWVDLVRFQEARSSLNKSIVEVMRGADIVVHDMQIMMSNYPLDQYGDRNGEDDFFYDVKDLLMVDGALFQTGDWVSVFACKTRFYNGQTDVFEAAKDFYGDDIFCQLRRQPMKIPVNAEAVKSVEYFARAVLSEVEARDLDQSTVIRSKKIVRSARL